MTAYDPKAIPVFAGPSLSGWRAAPPFVRHPPAAAGDLIGLLHGRPCSIVLIDGLFNEYRSVWHKEILVLLARGFRVIGAASMGALRAAELAPFGMIGCGPIFAAYAAGRITADDEVAVVHAPVEFGAAPMSVAQVDVRATLVRARRGGVIDGRCARALRAISAAIHYRDRTWAAVIAAGEEGGLDLDRFAAWAAAHPFSQKTADATAALALAMRLAPSPPAARPEPPATDFLRLAAHFAGVSLDAGKATAWTAPSPHTILPF